MKKEDELLHLIPDLVKETKRGTLKWKVVCQTTEYNDISKKPTTQEDDVLWVVDECYVCYECEYNGKDFLMITYEMIHSFGEQKKTTNLIFMPPLGIRYFDIHALLPYAIKASSMLVYSIHTLWLTVLETSKTRPKQVQLDVSPRELTIE